MFDHSIKVPRLYKTAAKIAKDVQENKGSLKQLIYQIKHQNIKAMYALIVEMFKRRNELDNLLKRSKLLVNEPMLDPVLARILITELLWRKKRLAGESKPIKTVLGYEQILKAHLSDVTNNSSIENIPQVQKPRYVRVNTLGMSVEEAVNGFRDEEWNFLRYNDKQDYNGFLEAVKSLGEYDFMVDIHIPELLVFHPRAQFYNHFAYKEGKIILQDKASCLPAFILNPEKGSTVLDMCAAPGMKTTHLAALMNNEGTIYASEIDQKRIEVLENILETAGVTCVKTINKDVLTVTDTECPNIEYILVDPSCSGTGILDRLELEEHMKDQQQRLTKLAGFQIKILRHALTKFPSAKRVVYSTCSLNAEENEDVVRQVLETCTTFKLVPAKQFLGNIWLNYGSPDFGNIGKYCLYTKPEIDLTNGFFIAVFERLEDGEENEFLNKNARMKIRKNRERNKLDEKYNDIEGNVENEAHISYKNKRKHDEIIEEENQTAELKFGKTKKQKRGVFSNVNEEIQNDNEVIVQEDTCQKKSKKKKATELQQNCTDDTYQESLVVPQNLEENETMICEKAGKKKKKKNKNEALEITYNDSNVGAVTQENEDAVPNEISKEIVKKKKKHKNKSSENKDHELYEHNEVTDEVNSAEISEKKKKKHKQKRNDESCSNDSSHISGTVEEVNTEETSLVKQKKKHKKKHKDSIEEIDSSEHLEVCDKNNPSGQITPDSQLPKKIKKKKNKHVENI